MSISNETAYRELFVGLDVMIPLLDGSLKRYINFDNAASTPALKAVQDAVNNFLLYYSSVHRGTGFKSQLSTYIFEEARAMVLRFVGANPDEHVCIFGKNTTEASNKLARRFPFSSQRNLVLVSTMEHHSNDLPWRAVAQVEHIAVTPDGRLDEADFDRLLEKYAGRVALVSITGASNVTGYINPIHRLAEKSHAAGAQFAADCAQLAPHRAVNMRSLSDPTHLDYVFISAHKLYAPYGTGALIGRRDTFEQGDPDLRGGGEVEMVTLDSVVWAAPPDRDEAGSPNTVGAVALASAIHQLQSIGLQKVADHEAELTAYILPRLKEIPGVKILGDDDPAQASDRLGVIPFNLGNLSHYLLSAILGYEFGIGVRNGCFCAHPYLLQLMGVNRAETEKVRREIVSGDRRAIPGLVRASFGLYNTTDEIDTFLQALRAIAANKYRGYYSQKVASGQYYPEGYKLEVSDYFKF
jgi:cysteine desulfurase/selenocysteine lyase